MAFLRFYDLFLKHKLTDKVIIQPHTPTHSSELSKFANKKEGRGLAVLKP